MHEHVGYTGITQHLTYFSSHVLGSVMLKAFTVQSDSDNMMGWKQSNPDCKGKKESAFLCAFFQVQSTLGGMHILMTHSLWEAFFVHCCAHNPLLWTRWLHLARGWWVFLCKSYQRLTYKRYRSSGCTIHLLLFSRRFLFHCNISLWLPLSDTCEGLVLYFVI